MKSWKHIRKYNDISCIRPINSYGYLWIWLNMYQSPTSMLGQATGVTVASNSCVDLGLGSSSQDGTIHGFLKNHKVDTSDLFCSTFKPSPMLPCSLLMFWSVCLKKDTLTHNSKHISPWKSLRFRWHIRRPLPRETSLPRTQTIRNPLSFLATAPETPTSPTFQGSACFYITFMNGDQKKKVFLQKVENILGSRTYEPGSTHTHSLFYMNVAKRNIPTRNSQDFQTETCSPHFQFLWSFRCSSHYYPCPLRMLCCGGSQRFAIWCNTAKRKRLSDIAKTCKSTWLDHFDFHISSALCRWASHELASERGCPDWAARLCPVSSVLMVNPGNGFAEILPTSDS